MPNDPPLTAADRFDKIGRAIDRADNCAYALGGLMTDKPKWESLSDRERREAVARELGWKCSTNPPYRWRHPSWRLEASTVAVLPDWPTNPGLAFAEVWPVLLKENKNLLLGSGDSSIPWNCAVLSIVEADGLSCELEYFVQGDTWADAICHAFYELKGESE